MPRGGAAWLTEINAPGSGYGSGFNRTPLTTLKTALLAPTPMAMVSNVTIVNIGERIRRRTTWRISLRIVTFEPLVRGDAGRRLLVNTPLARGSSQFLGCRRPWAAGNRLPLQWGHVGQIIH